MRANRKSFQAPANDQAGGRDRRGGERQGDAPEGAEVPGPVGQRRLLDLDREVEEGLAQQTTTNGSRAVASSRTSPVRVSRRPSAWIIR